MTVDVTEVDLRVGGNYRFVLESPDGTHLPVNGTYTVIDPPSRLAYTWSWETPGMDTDTLVTVEFIERGAQTEVVLRHEALSGEASRKNHADGWNGCIAKLETILT